MLIGRGFTDAHLDPAMACRHGLITGSTGSGKTVSLRVLVENFSNIGVPTFLADCKGDLSGLAKPGNMEERAKKLNMTYVPVGYPVVFWDLLGDKGHPVRAVVHNLGPNLMARLMGLNQVQSGVMVALWKMIHDESVRRGTPGKLCIVDLNALQVGLKELGDHASRYSLDYGNVNFASVGAIQRAILEMKSQGVNQFFNAPEFEIQDLFKVDEWGRGVINILQADTIINQPKLYSTYLLWMLSELYEKLPECGDLKKPKLVFFFDEAHLLFQDMPKILLQKIEQIIRLVRSKGVGVYFISQNPLDIPELILGQLGNRVQHALRAFTPREQRAIRAVSDTFRQNPRFNTQRVLLGLGTGEALVSFLEPNGNPAMVEKVLICPPQSDLTPLPEEEIKQVVSLNTKMEEKYRTVLFDTTEVVSSKSESDFEGKLYNFGRRLGRHAGYTLTNIIVRSLFHVFRGGRSTIGR